MRKLQTGHRCSACKPVQGDGKLFFFRFGDLKVRLAKHSYHHMKKKPKLAHVITQRHLQAILRPI